MSEATPYFECDGGAVRIYHADARSIPLPDGCVQTCVTSPPYFGLRDYGVAGQIGLEETPEQYVAAMVGVFRGVRRVLKDDGCLWLNIGDSYASGGGAGMQGKSGDRANRRHTQTALGPTRVTRGSRGGHEGKHGYMETATTDGPNRGPLPGIKPKDLIGIPWMLAFALRADGWYLRQDIIWHKPAPMPESVSDRCTKAHEYLFLLTKSPRYYFDADAIAEASAYPDDDRAGRAREDQKCYPTDERNGIRARKVNGGSGFGKQNIDVTGTGAQSRTFDRPVYDTRNKRSVWTVAAVGYPGAHFATFPPALVEPCILAGSRPGDLILDPFSGSGTTGQVARKWGRRYAGVELNPAYIELSKERFREGILFAPRAAVDRESA
jgi:DNA modification methylase